jgi:hypothetical protein
MEFRMHGDYLANTMILGLAKLIPVILFSIAGYFIFIKLPFWVFLRVLRASKGLPAYQMAQFSWESPQYKPDYGVNNYEAFLRKQKRAQEAEAIYQQQVIAEREHIQETRREATNSGVDTEANEKRKRYVEELRMKSQADARKREEDRRRRDEAKRARAEEARRQKAEEERREEQKKYARQNDGLEAIFSFKSGESFSRSELKKRYFTLLKTHHPDRFASQGEEAKLQAEIRTKEINSAYERLLSRAA